MLWWLAATASDGRWHPGIGDPDFLGWFTTVAYLAAAGVCGWAWRRERAGARRRGGETFRPVFWLGLMIAMIALGINKQLDLQTWFTEVGRDMAVSQGWYTRRQRVQIWFIAGLCAAGLLGVAVLAWWFRGHNRRYRLAIIGILYLVVFVVIRAASFHHVDVLIHMGFEHLKVNHVLEIGGITIVGMGAVKAVRTAGRG